MSSIPTERPSLGAIIEIADDDAGERWSMVSSGPRVLQVESGEHGAFRCEGHDPAVVFTLQHRFLGAVPVETGERAARRIGSRRNMTFLSLPRCSGMIGCIWPRILSPGLRVESSNPRFQEAPRDFPGGRNRDVSSV